jgi:arylsulfatase A-like enzyme
LAPFVDLAPTFLDAAGATIPETMCGRSLLPILLSKKEGQVDPKRDHVIFGKERLAEMLDTELKATNDPRILGGGEKFDEYPYRARYQLRDGSQGKQPTD